MSAAIVPYYDTYGLFRTLYFHNSTKYAETLPFPGCVLKMPKSDMVGQMVNKGEQIATLGQTGQATGPCLSLKVMVEGEAVNPLK